MSDDSLREGITERKEKIPVMPLRPNPILDISEISEKYLSNPLGWSSHISRIQYILMAADLKSIERAKSTVFILLLFGWGMEGIYKSKIRHLKKKLRYIQQEREVAIFKQVFIK